jgi:hypothetical protein
MQQYGVLSRAAALLTPLSLHDRRADEPQEQPNAFPSTPSRYDTVLHAMQSNTAINTCTQVRVTAPSSPAISTNSTPMLALHSSLLHRHRYGVCASLCALGGVRQGMVNILHGACHEGIPRRRATSRRHTLYNEEHPRFCLRKSLGQPQGCSRSHLNTTGCTAFLSSRSSSTVLCRGDCTINILLSPLGNERSHPHKTRQRVSAEYLQATPDVHSTPSYVLPQVQASAVV